MHRNGVCFIGYGETVSSRDNHPQEMYLAEAIQKALQNAGIRKNEVNGLALGKILISEDTPDIMERLGFELDWVEGVDSGGASGIVSVRRAADAIQLGEIDVAVCVAGGPPLGGRRILPTWQTNNYVLPFGFGGPNSLFALTQRLHMERYGTTLEQLGKIAVSLRKNAEHNENAFFRTPLTLEEYLNARIIADPIRLFDCCRIVSGAAAVVLASERKAKKVVEHPIYLVSDVEKAGYQVTSMAPDRLVTGYRTFADTLFSDIKREEIDFVEIYDDYPIAVLMQLEELGFCPEGGGGKFIENHDITFDGDFPINTGGGQLSSGQKSRGGGAFLHVVEAVRQLKGEATGHQVKGAKTGLVTGLGLFGYLTPLMCAAAMVLQRR
jgi:acetyl-CoA acetyltransferase